MAFVFPIPFVEGAFMSITSEQQNNILGVIVGLFNASPGFNFLAYFATMIENGTTEAQLADTLATSSEFINDIIGGKTPAAQVAELMNHYGLIADNIAGSPASQAEAFFTNNINAGVGFGSIVFQATSFLLNDSVPASFTETANLLKNKIAVADIHSATIISTDLATLQTPMFGLDGSRVLTPAEATNFLVTKEFLFRVNASSVTLNLETHGPLSDPVGIIDAPDSFSVNIIGPGLDSDFLHVGAGFSVTPLDATGITAEGNAETFTLNVTINTNLYPRLIDANQIIVNGVENLVISSTVIPTDNSVPGYVISESGLTATFIAPDAETITITGNGGVWIGNWWSSRFDKVSVINAAGSTGDISINFVEHTQSVTYTGSSGRDSYLGSTQGDIISGGQGNDSFVLEPAKAAQDILVLDGVTDAQILGTNTDDKVTILSNSGFERIDNFTVGRASTADRVDVSSTGFSGAQRGIVDVSAKVSEFTDLTSIPDLFSDSAGDRGVAFSQVMAPAPFIGSHPTIPLPTEPFLFVFVDANKDGDFTAADDMVIGISGADPLSVDNFIF